MQQEMLYYANKHLKRGKKYHEIISSKSHAFVFNVSWHDLAQFLCTNDSL